MDIRHKVRFQEMAAWGRTKIFVAIEADGVPCGELCIASIPSDLAEKLINGTMTLKQVQEQTFGWRV